MRNHPHPRTRQRARRHRPPAPGRPKTRGIDFKRLVAELRPELRESFGHVPTPPLFAATVQRTEGRVVSKDASA